MAGAAGAGAQVNAPVRFQAGDTPASHITGLPFPGGF